MKKTNSVLLSLPYIIWMVVFTLIPLGVVCYYAMTDPTTGAFTLNNLKELGAYWGVLGQSILYSLVSAFICLLLGYPVAYFIAHQGKVAQKILYMLVMLPMCMSFLLRTLAWAGLLQDTGIINDFLDLIGIGIVFFLNLFDLRRDLTLLFLQLLDLLTDLLGGGCGRRGGNGYTAQQHQRRQGKSHEGYPKFAIFHISLQMWAAFRPAGIGN